MMAAGLDFRLTFMRPGEEAGLGSFLFEGELEPVDDKDYDCVVDLFRTLMAIKRLDAVRKLAIGFYLEANVRPTSWLFNVNGFVAEIPAGKLVSFEEALSTWLSRMKCDKSKVEHKANEVARTCEATFDKEE